jgi:hypothetical protein
MGLIQLKQVIRRLSLGQLRRLDDWLHELIRKTEESDGSERVPPRKQVTGERAVEDRTYRLEEVRCGKEKCKCTKGKLHGPYWYSYTRVGGKVKSQYIGRKLPRAIK